MHNKIRNIEKTDSYSQIDIALFTSKSELMSTPVSILANEMNIFGNA